MTEVTNAKLETKLKQLKITVDRTHQITESNRQDAIERHCTTIKSITDSINEIRVAIQESKIQAEVYITEIANWNDEIDKKLEAADLAVERLRKWIDEHKREKENVAREEQIQFETKRFETEMKLETQLASVKEETPTTKNGNKTGETLAKLPKLAISKFCGNFQDWQRFWGQFTETVDKTSMPPSSQSLHICVSCSTLR